MRKFDEFFVALRRCCGVGASAEGKEGEGVNKIFARGFGRFLDIQFMRNEKIGVVACQLCLRKVEV